MSFKSFPQRSIKPASTPASNMRDELKGLALNLQKKHPSRKTYNYIPEVDLRGTITPDMIGEWISFTCPDANGPKRLSNKIHERALRTFCILLMIEREDFIKTFMEDLHSDPDASLPWVNGYTLKAFLDKNASPPRFGSQSKADEFCREQWVFCPFSLREGDHETFENTSAIPFLCEVPFKPRSGASGLFKVKVDPRYYTSRKSQESWPKEGIDMVRKQLGVNGEKEQHFSEYIAYLSDDINEDQRRPQCFMTRLYASYTLNDKISLLMPEYDGDLSNFLNNQMDSNYFRDEQHYLSAMLGLSRALAWLHCLPDNRVYSVTGIHHDLKPANIFLDKGHMILSDFGISSLSNPTEGKWRDAKGHVSWYTAPECLTLGARRPGKVSVASDMFSLGCIFAEILSYMSEGPAGVMKFRDGRKPNKTKENSPFCIDGKVIPEVWSGLTNMRPEPSRKVRHGVIDLVEQLLSEDPITRLSADSLVAGLEVLVQGPEKKSSSLEYRPYPHSPQKSMAPNIPHPPNDDNHSNLAETSAMAANKKRADGDSLSDSQQDIYVTRSSLLAALGSSGVEYEKDLRLALKIELDPLDQGRAKNIWEEKQWIPRWAKEAKSGCLLIHSTEEKDHEKVLSMISAQLIQSAKRGGSPGIRMRVIYHFCDRHTSARSGCLFNMIQSLLLQLISFSAGDAETLLDSLPLQQNPKGLEDMKDAFVRHIKSLSAGTILVVVIDCLRPYCYGHREAETVSVLRSLVELSSNNSSHLCCFKFFLTLSGTALANKISRECRFEKAGVVKYDDGGLVNHPYGYTDHDFREKIIQWS